MKTKEKFYEEFYDIFKKAINDNIYPNMIFALTGGLDTRLIAGILFESNIELPSFCFGSKIERVISCKIANILNFNHFTSTSYDEAFTILENKGFEYILGGNCFDEINGGYSGFKAKSYKKFKEIQKTGLNRKIENICNFKYNLRFILPVFNIEVFRYIESIPFQYRINKKIQRYLIKKHFPKLWNIPYYNSLLPNVIPYELHIFPTFLHYYKHYVKWIKKYRLGKMYEHYIKWIKKLKIF